MVSCGDVDNILNVPVELISLKINIHTFTHKLAKLSGGFKA